MLPWLLPLGTALLSTAGQALTNRANKDQAREQMAFQERMSSTAAQRSAKDYAAAGFNPALAYDRPASSPGGAAAILGNAAEKGISTAFQTQQLRQALKIAAEQHQADLILKREQAGAAKAANAAATSQAESTWEDTRLKRQQFEFNTAWQPADVRQRTATALLQEYALPRAKAEAEFFGNSVGKFAPWINSAKSLTSILSGLRK